MVRVEEREKDRAEEEERNCAAWCGEETTAERSMQTLSHTHTHTMISTAFHSRTQTLKDLHTPVLDSRSIPKQQKTYGAGVSLLLIH